ncbi:hypothetical protein AKJ16_DCAP14760 [Drosera capensis]
MGRSDFLSCRDILDMNLHLSPEVGGVWITGKLSRLGHRQGGRLDISAPPVAWNVLMLQGVVARTELAKHINFQHVKALDSSFQARNSSFTGYLTGELYVSRND